MTALHLSRNPKGASRPGRPRKYWHVLAVLGGLAGIFGNAGAAYACPCAAVMAARGAATIALIQAEQDATRDHITQEFIDHRDWLVNIYFKQYILPAMAMATEQMSSVAMMQMMIVGSFLDAKNQLETQRLFQTLAARAHKDYHPSEGLCTLGSSMRSLAASDRNADLTARLLSQHSMDRQLLNVNANASEGQKEDREGRLAQFRSTYCDKNDNNRGLTTICAAAVPQARKNKDVDFTRTVMTPMTLDINFSDTVKTDDEEDVIALMSNLYSHKVFDPIPAAKLRMPSRFAMANRELILDMRSIVAKRSVAEQPFQAIIGMKTRGTTNVSQLYLQKVLEEMGIPAAEATAIIGTNPSYYAQMEILTKRVFQRPEFFVDLYDKPANVARKGVALQAISMMQKRDIFKSNLRSEAIISVLLELELMKAQEAVQNELDRSSDTKN